MESYIILALVVFVIILISRISSANSSKKKLFKNNTYDYFAKPSLMSKVEGEFFVKLERIVRGRYYIFPQVHLSAILDHRIKGQEWNYAFRHINGKSVDYVLCNRDTLEPTYAIELDDYTHDKVDRRKRDIEVERIFKAANLPLVRFRSKDILDDEIIQALADAKKLASARFSS